MDTVVLKYILPIVTIVGLIGTVSTQELSVRLTMHPSDNGGKVVANSTVVFRCMVDMSILGHDAVTWYRRQGVNRYELGTGSFRTHWSVAPRYHLETQSRTSSSVVYSLSITNVQVEDSATIECVGKQSTRKASLVLAVCADINSQLCDCTLRSGWTSPDCIYAADSDDGFDRAVVGLAVCLAVTLLYAAVATAIVVYDCRHKLIKERQRAAEREATLAHAATVISSKTAASSAMKPRSSCAAVNGRQTVKFIDNSIPKTDISC